MNRQRLAILFGLFLITALPLLSAADPAPAAKSDASKEDLSVRIAKAQLQLAEATLAKAQQMNKRLPRLLPADMIAQFNDDVAIAKAQLQSVEQTKQADSLAGWIRRAESSLRSAENNLKNAVSVNQQAPNTFEPLDIERLKLRVDIARMQLERGQSLASASPDAKLQWQVDLLNDELARLREQTAKIIQNRIPASY